MCRPQFDVLLRKGKNTVWDTSRTDKEQKHKKQAGIATIIQNKVRKIAVFMKSERTRNKTMKNCPTDNKDKELIFPVKQLYNRKDNVGHVILTLHKYNELKNIHDATWIAAIDEEATHYA